MSRRQGAATRAAPLTSRDVHAGRDAAKGTAAAAAHRCRAPGEMPRRAGPGGGGEGSRAERARLVVTRHDGQLAVRYHEQRGDGRAARGAVEVVGGEQPVL